MKVLLRFQFQRHSASEPYKTSSGQASLAVICTGFSGEVFHHMFRDKIVILWEALKFGVIFQKFALKLLKYEK